MKALKDRLVTGMERYTVPQSNTPEQEYEQLVHETAKMIGRSYIATAKMVEKWPLELIKRRLYASQKATKPAMEWWVMRKHNR